MLRIAYFIYIFWKINNDYFVVQEVTMLRIATHAALSVASSLQDTISYLLSFLFVVAQKVLKQSFKKSKILRLSKLQKLIFFSSSKYQYFFLIRTNKAIEFFEITIFPIL